MVNFTSQLLFSVFSYFMADKIFDTRFLPDDTEMEVLADFIAVVRQLRRDCPWDREQTHESVKHLMIEEVYEAVEAIDMEDWDELKKELGDVLLHVVFHSAIAEPDGRFTLKDIVQAEMDKLIRRHPHVFGDTKVDGTQEVLSNWEAIKKKEAGRTSVLDGVPANLPALLRAYRIQEKAAGVGFDFPDREQTWGKVEEELLEFKESVVKGSTAAREEELGDLFFALVNYARFHDIKPENALRHTCNKFIHRFKHIEQRLTEQQKEFDEVSLEEMDVYWEEAKRSESH